MIVVRIACVLGIVVLASGCDTQQGSVNPRTGTRRDSSEQVLYGARSVVAANGIRRADVAGDTVLVFDAGTRFEFQGFRAQFWTTLGRPLALLTSKSATYRVPGDVVARGPVAIVSDTVHRRIDGAWVRYDVEKNQFVSDSAFTATAGTRRLSGVGFTADPGLFSVKCAKKCTGSLAP